MPTQEANFDGLVGPTHNYSGLSYGNVASEKHRHRVANPKKAALQGLEKMHALAKRGFIQGIIPPQERPHLPTLRCLGFSGTDAEVIAEAAREAPYLLASASSASAMWTANAATVSPSADTADGKIHFTPANLHNKFHRSIESLQTGRILQRIFEDPRYFVHHQALPCVDQLGDEGAANHTRFCQNYGDPGIELFVYGKRGFAEASSESSIPKRFPARQSLEAAQAIARLHGLTKARTLFVQQNPEVIDAGVFHNDVIAVGNRNTLFFHENAFLQTTSLLENLRRGLGENFSAIQVPKDVVSVEDAVSSYLFNSQLLSVAPEKMLLLVPKECQENLTVWRYLETLPSQNTPIQEVHSFDLRESMQNGGGPACLRLRIVLTEEELAAVHPNCLLNSGRYHQLIQWVEKHYRDRLTEADLADPQLLVESRAALDELTQLLDLGKFYEFQQK